MPYFGSAFSGLANDEEKFYAEGIKEVEEKIEKLK